MKTVSASATGIMITYDKVGHRKRKTDYQLYEHEQRRSINKIPVMNPLQEIMILRLEKGTNFYTQKELSDMPSDIVREIRVNDDTAKLAVRKLKVNTFFYAENRLLNNIFPNVHLGSKLTDYYVGCEGALRASFKTLKITKTILSKAFINCGLLPRNFLSITSQTLSL